MEPIEAERPKGGAPCRVAPGARPARIVPAMSVAHALARRPLALADALLNRLYGWRGNPLHQSGALVLLAFVVMLVTGLYLLLFYRIGAPFESIARIDAQPLAGRWIRALHR